MIPIFKKIGTLPLYQLFKIVLNGIIFQWIICKTISLKIYILNEISDSLTVYVENASTMDYMLS